MVTKTKSYEGYRRRERVNSVLFCILIAFIVIICLFPFIWTILTSIKPTEQIFDLPIVWIPAYVNYKNYITIFTVHPFLTYIKNSAIVAVCTTLFCLVVGSLTAYSLARLRFRGKTTVLTLVLAVSMFPQIAIVGTLAKILTGIHLINTYADLIFPYTTLCLPLTIWILVTFFRTIPLELENAALVDGCTRMQAFRKIIFPLAAPGLATCTILVFIFAWNEFMFAQTFMQSENMYTITIGLTMFEGQYTIPWGEISAAAVVVTIPLIILVLLFQKRIVQGLTGGAVKG